MNQTWNVSKSIHLTIIACIFWLGNFATAHAAPEGEIFFFQQARSSFDGYIESPSAQQQNWMRSHYHRLLGWSPHFDSRLSWFPNGWAYVGAYTIKPDDPVFSLQPNWILRAQDNSQLYVPFDCSGGTCPQYAADFGNPDFRAYWIAQARKLQAAGYVGLWIDDVNMTWRVSDGNGNHVTPIDPRTGSLMTLTNWRRYMAEFMEQVRAALPRMELAHNIVWFSGSTDNNNPYIQRQLLAANYINLERGVTDRGLTGGDGRWSLETFLKFIDYVHSLRRAVILMDEGGTTTQREYALAGWFAISNGSDWMSSEALEWTAPDRWWHGYDTNLGAALGPRYHWNDLIRRDFECGMVLLNKPDWPSISVSLGQTYTNLAGQSVAAVTLAGDQSVILQRPCGSSAPPDTDTLKQVDVRVNSRIDDVEQRLDTGGMIMNSSDLEISNDVSKRLDQIVGIRFTDIQVPNNATIESAYIQFQVDEVSVGSAQFWIAIEDTDHAAAFTNRAYHLSNRPLLSSQYWQPNTWPTVGRQTTNQRTSDLAALVQEVVNRPGWSAGNAMSFVISGDGERNAESYDGSTTGAPLLHIEYRTAP